MLNRMYWMIFLVTIDSKIEQHIACPLINDADEEIPQEVLTFVNGEYSK